jgi:hypothetical protein
MPVISRLSQRILESNRFDEPTRMAYLELFQSIRHDLKVLPGTTTVLEMMAERLAYLHLHIKQRDAGLVGAQHSETSIGPAMDYERLSNLHLKYGQILLGFVGKVNQTETERIDAARRALEPLLDIIDDEPMTDSEKTRIKMRLAEQFRAMVD